MDMIEVIKRGRKGNKRIEIKDLQKNKCRIITLFDDKNEYDVERLKELILKCIARKEGVRVA